MLRLLGVVTRSNPNMIIMEYLSQGRLSDLLGKHRGDPSKHIPSAPLPLGLRLQMMADISSGMAFLSARGYVHKCLRTK